MSGFKAYLINENEQFLMQKVGDILSSLQSMLNEIDNLGNRQLVRASMTIVNQIRKVLNEYWPDEVMPMLKQLQKVGVALMRAIDGSDDLKQMIASSVKALEMAVTKNKNPINNIGSEGKPPQ